MNNLIESPGIDTVPDPLPDEPNPFEVDVAAPGQPTARPLPSITDAAVFISERLTEPQQVVAGILHKGCKLSLGGSSKSFKTFTLLDLALSVSHGVPWLNLKTNPSPVLFVNFELQDWTIQRRLEAIARAKGITIEPGKLFILNLRGHAAPYHLLFPKIKEQMNRGYGLCILDPTYKLYGISDKENDAGDMAQLLNAIDELTVDTGAAVAYGQHFSKGNQSGKESIDRVSGSGVWARDPDTIITMTRHESDDCFAVENTLRAFKPVPPFVVRWEYPLFKMANELDPAKLKRAAGRHKEHDPVKLLSLISDTNPQNSISISAWATAGNVPRQTLRDYLLEMRRNGWVQTTGEGNTARQHITKDGRALLKERPA